MFVCVCAHADGFQSLRPPSSPGVFPHLFHEAPRPRIQPVRETEGLSPGHLRVHRTRWQRALPLSSVFRDRNGGRVAVFCLALVGKHFVPNRIGTKCVHLPLCLPASLQARAFVYELWSEDASMNARTHSLYALRYKWVAHYSVADTFQRIHF